MTLPLSVRQVIPLIVVQCQAELTLITARKKKKEVLQKHNIETIKLRQYSKSRQVE